MADQEETYPRARIAMGSGDLMDVTSLKVTTKNGAKEHHTLRVDGAGVFTGPEETMITFDYSVSAKGAERDYINFLRTKKRKQLRIKVPGETITVNGKIGERTLESTVDDVIKGSIQFVGKLA